MKKCGNCNKEEGHLICLNYEWSGKWQDYEYICVPCWEEEMEVFD